MVPLADKIIREIPLIARYSRHNEAEDHAFAYFLKSRLSLSNSELNAIVQETTTAVWDQIDCTACAHCCRTREIVVDDADIERLSQCLDITTGYFNSRYVQVARDRTKHFKSQPCPFLGTNNHCTVYEDRPQACRDFPYLREKNFRSRALVMMENTSECPIVFNVWQALKQRLWKRHKK